MSAHPTREQLLDLCAEAERHAATEQIALCERALRGDANAIEACERALDAAAANLSPPEAWESYVGTQSPQEFANAAHPEPPRRALLAYVRECPFGYVPPSAVRMLQAYLESQVTS